VASPSQSFQIRKSYGHNFSRVIMHNLQAVYESTVKNGHRILADDVWIDEVDYCANETAADLFVTSHPTILRKRTKVSMEPVSGTNNQIYRFVDAGVWVNRWLAPVDVVNQAGETSQGFAARLYDANDNLITLTEGVYVINYFTGMIEFDVGYTPIDRGYALPLKATFYEYIGRTISDLVVSAPREYRDRITATESLVYDLSNMPVSNPKIFCNGILLGTDDYVVAGKQITFSSDVVVGTDKLDVFYNY
jgi:hypothetical protein